jgi:diadenosine tetraphosphatase ApaH/serine/threonine PP2A family protein phosphatase
MIAVISDIHANLEALCAVLEELDALAPEFTVCLGDIVGYGPDPVACIDAVRRRCKVTLCGNHDFALVYGTFDFTPAARDRIEQHRRLVMPRPSLPGADRDRQDRWDWLKNLPHRYVRADMLFVHGAPRNPVVEYLRKMDVLLGLADKFAENFRQVDWLCFVGHTHQPGVITPEMRHYAPEELGGSFAAEPHQKAIINVGSVGQPRDGDWRSCFVTVEEDGLVRWHRVAYDVDRAATKMAAAGSNGGLAERLRRGR